MSPQTLLILLGLSAGSGLAIYLGALLGWLSHRRNRMMDPAWHHFILSFGGGALVAAVGLVLVPDGISLLDPVIGLPIFLFGGAVFLLIDRVLHALKTPLSQLVAVLADFLPESIVLGAIIATDLRMAIVLAVIIAAQNLPEGYAAFCEMRDHETDGSVVKRRPLTIMALCVLLGPLAALFGYFVCDAMDPGLGALMLFCGGGILFIVFRDIAPKANLECNAYPAFGALLGFSIGVIGFSLIH